ncbi:aldo/keto reductase [Streptomyces sp. NBC_01317]|uniref:aldo/keto reductase n=1 Tax=Streptomyces sp. NBC_01317 TaxID=2903822 RepID=UPI002E161331|nr:aldo/keto reductase [Streptomyces sp. NBC_01317]
MSDSTITPLTQVRLGTTGPEVGAQGFGCMGLSDTYGPTTDVVEARATLERALELGVTLFDTADVYGQGENEKFIAPFVQAHRDEIVLATKFGIGVSATDPALRTIRNDRAYLRACVEGSLTRLGVDVIDLYYMHRRDVSVPVEETVGAMAELVAEGKVKHLGLSEVTAGELRAAQAVHPIAALQSEWSLFSRDIEARIVPAAVELGVALVAYSPLGRGFLTGSFVNAEQELGEDDFRRRQPRFNGPNARANAALLEPVRKIAEGRNATLGQVALAWAQQRSAIHGLTVVPIPGTRSRARVEENTAATRLVLTDSELDLLEPIASRVAGGRSADLTFVSEGRE